MTGFLSGKKDSEEEEVQEEPTTAIATAYQSVEIDEDGEPQVDTATNGKSQHDYHDQSIRDRVLPNLRVADHALLRYAEVAHDP